MSTLEGALLQWAWWNIGTGDPERLRSLHLWRYTKSVRLDDLQRALPISTILWLCDFITMEISASIFSVFLMKKYFLWYKFLFCPGLIILSMIIIRQDICFPRQQYSHCCQVLDIWWIVLNKTVTKWTYESWYQMPNLLHDQYHKSSFSSIAGVSERTQTVTQKCELNIRYACDRLTMGTAVYLPVLSHFKQYLHISESC